MKQPDMKVSSTPPLALAIVLVLGVLFLSIIQIHSKNLNPKESESISFQELIPQTLFEEKEEQH